MFGISQPNRLIVCLTGRKYVGFLKKLPKTQEKLMLLWGLGYHLYKTREYDELSDEIHKAILNLKSNSAEAHYNYALLLAEMGKRDEAERHFLSSWVNRSGLPDRGMRFARIIIDIAVKRSREGMRDFDYAKILIEAVTVRADDLYSRLNVLSEEEIEELRKHLNFLLSVARDRGLERLKVRVEEMLRDLESKD